MAAVGVGRDFIELRAGDVVADTNTEDDDAVSPGLLRGDLGLVRFVGLPVRHDHSDVGNSRTVAAGGLVSRLGGKEDFDQNSL